MSNPVRSVLFLCLALFSSAELVGATLQIQVYDYALIGPASLGKFVSEFEDILRYTEVSVQVRVCRGSVAVVCGEPEGPVIRILPGSAKTIRNLRRPPLGQSFATPTGGSYATIFLEAVQDEAAAADAPWVVVLAHAAAHEIGHLLLGNQAHSRSGLMREIWDRKDYEAMIQHRLRFSEDEARKLASRYREEP
jgi:hypothetical protein